MTTIPQLPVPTWFVGCGNMGGAIVQGWLSAGLDLSSAVVIRPSGRPVEGVRTVTSLSEAGAAPRLVILGVKPQKLDEVAGQLHSSLAEGAVIVSLLAGVEVDSLRNRFPNAGAIVRAMPNIPVSIRRGVIGLFSKDADEKLRRHLSEVFAPLGFAPCGSPAGASPSGKAPVFGTGIRRFESCRPSQSTADMHLPSGSGGWSLHRLASGHRQRLIVAGIRHWAGRTPSRRRERDCRHLQSLT